MSYLKKIAAGREVQASRPSVRCAAALLLGLILAHTTAEALGQPPQGSPRSLAEVYGGQNGWSHDGQADYRRPANTPPPPVKIASEPTRAPVRSALPLPIKIPADPADEGVAGGGGGEITGGNEGDVGPVESNEAGPGDVEVLDQILLDDWNLDAGAARLIGWGPLRGRLWVDGEYLMWWTKGVELVPLVTTGAITTPPNAAGALGRSDTTVLFGDQSEVEALRSGGKLTVGWWFGPCQCDAIEATYFALGKDAAHFRANSDSMPVLARPVFDTDTGTQAAMLVSYRHLLRGSVAADVSSALQSTEVLWRRRFSTGCENRIDLLAGYRFARLDEGVGILQSSEFIGEGIIPGTTKDVLDQFGTENHFHGGELGVAYERCAGPWSLGLLMKVGLGNTRSDVFIDGGTRTTVPGVGTADFVGGLLAQRTNIGHFTRNDFAVVPELGVTLARDLTPRLRATFGYTLLYWSKVARPGDQIDLAVSQFPPEPPTGAHAPHLQFTTSDYWAQGMRFGLDFRF